MSKSPRPRGVNLTAEEYVRLDEELRRGPNPCAAARRFGCHVVTATRRAKELGLPLRRRRPLPGGATLAPAPAADGAPPAPREVHDAAFWRRAATDARKEVARLGHLVEEMAGLRGVPVTVPNWLVSERQGRAGKSVVGCLVSDVHMGETIAAEEIGGINAFDPAICAARLRRYFTAACVVGARWASDTACEGALLSLAGDLVSGDIHEELRITNALTSHEQVAAVVAELAAGIRTLVDAFGRVHVVGVPGNHGRTTVKPTAKLYARLSYDVAAVARLAEIFAGDARVTFQVDANTDQVTPVFGRAVLTTHGDKIGTRGGTGFAGPDLPIVRGAKKVREQYSSLGHDVYLIQAGHYHWWSNPAHGRVIFNGSVPGYAEFARDIRAVVEPPQQTLWLMHSRWGLRERMPIQLEDPSPSPGPRVRVKAWSAAA